MDYSLIQTLVEAAYHKFKYEFPNEEPFFRITCTRKFGRSEKRSWRNPDGVDDMRVVSKEGKVTKQQVTIGNLKLDGSIKVRSDDKLKNDHERNRWISPRKTLPLMNRRVIDADKKTILTTKFNYDAMVDVRFDEPLIVSSVRYFMNTTNGLLKEIQEGYRVFLEDPTIWKGNEVFMMNMGQGVTFEDRLEKAIKAVKNHDDKVKYIEMKIQTVESMAQTEEFTCFDCDDVINNLKTTFKTTLSIRDLADKYINVQKKLNDLKSTVLPLFKRYKHLNLHDMMQKEGFIKTIGFLIDFLDTMGDDQDDYVDDYD